MCDARRVKRYMHPTAYTQSYPNCFPFVEVADSLQIKLSAALCRARKLSPEVAALICGGQPDEVVIPDCTQLKEEDFVAVLKQLSTGRSVYVLLEEEHMAALIQKAHKQSKEPLCTVRFAAQIAIPLMAAKARFSKRI